MSKKFLQTSCALTLIGVSFFSFSARSMDRLQQDVESNKASGRGNPTPPPHHPQPAGGCGQLLQTNHLEIDLDVNQRGRDLQPNVRPIPGPIIRSRLFFSDDDNIQLSKEEEEFLGKVCFTWKSIDWPITRSDFEQELNFSYSPRKENQEKIIKIFFDQKGLKKLHLKEAFISEDLWKNCRSLSSLEEIHLCDLENSAWDLWNFSRKSAENIAQGLSCNSVLRVLKISNSGLNDESAATILHSVARITTLQTLDFHSNNLGNAAIKTLAHALESPPTLRELSLTRNPIEKNDFETLACAVEHSAVLEKLILRESLGSAWFCGNQKGIEALARVIGSNVPPLRELDLSGSRVAKTIIDMNEVRLIGSALKSNTVLRKLRLNWIEGPGSVTGDRIGNEEARIIADSLKNHPSLQELELNGSNIGDKGVKEFAKSLRHNKILQKLSLSNCHINDAGAETFSDVLLRFNRTLKKLDLASNHIGDKGKKALGQVSKERVDIFLWDNPRGRQNPMDDVMDDDYD